ncbi:MAG: antibiotic biosynthesis monooxygenase [Ramlibacter sp.]|nr:antibiotic biosynthesis monooxygenase [Cryobacterium sp.]
MTITAHLDLRLKPDALAIAPATLREVLADTRAFDGCVGVDVIVDRADPAHLILVERWASAAADARYREWRAGPGASGLASILAGPPQLTLFDTAEDI